MKNLALLELSLEDSMEINGGRMLEPLNPLGFWHAVADFTIGFITGRERTQEILWFMDNLELLKNEDLMAISGGHEGVAYTVGFLFGMSFAIMEHLYDLATAE